MSSQRLQQFLEAIAHLPPRKPGIKRHITEENGTLHLYFELDEHAQTVTMRESVIPWMMDLRNALLHFQSPIPSMVLSEWNDAIKAKQITYAQAAAHMNQVICNALTDYADATDAESMDAMQKRRNDAQAYLILWGYKEKEASELTAEALRNLDEGEPAFERPPITTARMKSTLKYWRAKQKRKRLKM